MVKVNFNLRLKSAKTAQPLVMVLRWSGNVLKYPTLIKVSPINFDTGKQRVKKVNAEPLHALINKSLDTMQQQAQKVYLEFTATGKIPIPKEYKTALDFATERKRIVKTEFWEFVALFMDAAKNRIVQATGKKISPRTIQRYNTTISLLREYEAESGNKLTFEGLDLPTLKDFIEWLTMGKQYGAKEKENYGINTVSKHWETLKAILTAAANDKHPVNLDYKSPLLKISREQPDTVYLSEPELQKLAAHNFTDNTRLEKVRDLFLIAAYTGLRFSDFTAIEPHHIGSELITIRQYKTGQNVSIPIHPVVRQLFEKYAHQSEKVKPISNQKFNEYIKEVCKLAGIAETIETQSTKGGVIVKELAPKYTLISSHTGRRSLATNLYKRGIPIQSIMAITGHRTEKAFRSYIRLSNIEHADIIKTVWDEK